MKKFYKYIFIILLLIHFYFLQQYGIATFVTTSIFYYSLYWLLKKIITKYFKAEKAKTYNHNLKMMLLILLFFEVLISISNSKLNDFTERKYNAYLSKYMKNKQLIFFNRIGLTKNKDANYENGYLPNSNQVQETSEFIFKVKYNSLGLRGKLPNINKDTNEYRITIIGDSFVEGYGANADSTFPFLLFKQLNRYKQNITVINGGVCGSNPSYEIQLYNNKLAKYKSDLVILELNNGDILDYSVSEKQGNMPLKEYFYAVSKVYRALHALINAEINLNKQKKKQIADMINEISNFKYQLSLNNKGLIILYLPLKNEIYEDKNTPTYNDITYKLKEKNIDFIDLHTLYRNYFINQKDSLNLFYWNVDGHHNGKGYNLCADIVAKEIILKNAKK